MLRIEFKTGNAAFRNEDDELDTEAVADFVKEKARVISTDIRYGYTSGTLMDINGNKVGKWKLDD